jgi:hypothetical protein
MELLAFISYGVAAALFVVGWFIPATKFIAGGLFFFVLPSFIKAAQAL